MRSLTRSLALLFVLSLHSSYAVSQSAPDKLLEQLQKEKDRLNRQTDPVGRTKSQIKIAEALLSLISRSVQSGDMDLMQKYLGDYMVAIHDAHTTMMKTGRDAHRKPGGFKDLEIALRRHVRQLDDIGKALTFDQREPLDKVKDEAADIRDDLLKALFGEENAPSRKS
jgi:hypothetical protein